MRKRVTHNGLTVNAVAGTNVILLGLNLTQAKRKNCLGFSILRTDKTENETYWMKGMKTFSDVSPAPGVSVSSKEHPFQSFQWCDYSVKESHKYVYKVYPMYLKNKERILGAPTIVEIQAESAEDGTHCVFFNRGAAASQEYVRRFKNRKPEEVGQAAYDWLSRGLFESIRDFIRRADDSTYGIYGAVYEFELDELLQEISDAAKKRKVKVKIVYDAIDDEQGADNEAAIAKYKLGKQVKARTIGTIMHNKFLVLTKDDKPVVVLTGSTNWSINGIYGHSNCCHIVNDKNIAAAYLTYWKQLVKDDESAAMRTWNAASNSTTSLKKLKDHGIIFSPTPGITELTNLATVAAGAKNALFMTFAFGMHSSFQDVYKTDDDILRIALMEKEGNGKTLEKGKKEIRSLRKRENVLVALGNTITVNIFDLWLKEMYSIKNTANIKWIHTKYMLVDPLSTTPTVVVGSANFSEASVNKNDENMLIIKGDTRVADIYLGEFMRLYSHYAFREAVKINQVEIDQGEWKPHHLEDTDVWQKDYFTKGHSRFIRRQYFAG